MIFIMMPDGTIPTNIPTSVYQGGADAVTIYIFAPTQAGATADCAFQTPDGVWTERTPMTCVATMPAEFAEYRYKVWKISLGQSITRISGTVTAQFFFHQSDGSVLASSATSFQVHKGVPSVLPSEPSQDAYDQILAQISAIQKLLQDGDYTARGVFAWRERRSNGDAVVYGQSDLVYYKMNWSGVDYGSIIQSTVSNNTYPPYVSADGKPKINNPYWIEIVNFDTISEQLYGVILHLAQEATSHADAAASARDEARKLRDETQALKYSAETTSYSYADEARKARDETQSLKTETEAVRADAAEFAAQASVSLLHSEEEVEKAKGFSEEAAAQADRSERIANLAQEAADRAEEFAKFGIRINSDYDSVDALPRPGNSQYIYLIANGSGEPNAFDEYIWTEKGGTGQYEKVGTTEIDLTAYLTKTAAAETYFVKPGNGIPETDLDSGVRAKLTRATNALTSVPAATATTLGGVKIKQGSDGIWDITTT